MAALQIFEIRVSGDRGGIVGTTGDLELQFKFLRLDCQEIESTGQLVWQGICSFKISVEMIVSEWR